MRTEYPAPLPHAEQLELCRRAQAGDVAARDKLILTSMRLVMQRAHVMIRIAGNGDVEDLVQDGVAAVAHAIELFDFDKGVHFATYARLWLDSRLRREAYSMRGVSPAAYNSASQSHSRRAETVAAAMAARVRPLSLDAPAHDEGATALVETIAGSETLQDEAAIADERAARVRAAVESVRRTCGPREQAVVDRIAATDDAETLGAIGERFGVSRERIRQLEVALEVRVRAAIARAFPGESTPAQYMRRRRAEHRHQRLCTACCAPAEPRLKMCARHIELARRAGEKHRRARGGAPRQSPRIIEYQGLALTLAQWAARTGISYQLLRYRLGAGMPLEHVFRATRKPGAQRVRTCARGHDVTDREARYPSGNCRACVTEAYAARKAAGCIHCGAPTLGTVRCAQCSRRRRQEMSGAPAEMPGGPTT